MGDKRDPERTRTALLDAALVEFAARGRAGARTSAIAARAGVNKQLISHHFGGKDGLYRALVERWEADEASFGGPGTPLADLVAGYVDDGLRQRDLHRLLLRASLEDTDGGGGLTGDDLADMRRRQAAGEVTELLDPAFLLLALQAIAAAGVVFPADVRRLTGLDPASPDFAGWHAGQLRKLAQLLADRDDMELVAIGWVESALTDRASAPKQGDEGAPEAWLVFEPGVAEGLDGVAAGDELLVLTWLDRARRDVLRVHPRGDPANREQGVFSTRSPDRPNPIGLHRVTVVAIDGLRLRVRDLEALDGTPVVDVKPLLRTVEER